MIVTNTRDGDDRAIELPEFDVEKEEKCKEVGRHSDMKYVSGEQNVGEGMQGKPVHGFVCFYCGGRTWADRTKTKRGA